MKVSIHLLSLLTRFCNDFQLFDNMKKSAKKALANEKVARKKTGGGTCESVTDDTCGKVLALLGNRARPLVNEFDADAEYNNDSGMLVQIIFLDI